MLERFVPPPTRELGELLEDMPGRRRSLGEVGWLLGALLGIGWFETGVRTLTPNTAVQTYALYGALLVLVISAYALVRPWRIVRLGRRRLGIAIWALLGPVALLAALGPLLRSRPPPPRIGVELTDAAVGGARRGARVTRVLSGSPADGRLVIGDLIVAANDKPLDQRHPANDLITRAQNARELPAGDARFSILRAGSQRFITVPLAEPARELSLRESFRATLLRDAALLALLGALLFSDGQRLRHLGLEHRGFALETRAAVVALGGLMVAHFLLSLVVTLIALLLGGNLLETEVTARREVVGTLVADQLRFTLPVIVFASITEEVVFRGFLLPRLRVLAGSWTIALLFNALFFGLGHVYEGTLATLQTAGVGLVLGLVYLWRRRLLASMLAHIGFNTLALLLALLALSLGLLGKAQELLQR